jgi:hypothetical protein
MKVLLDECIPRKLKSALAGHDCTTAPEAGLAARKMDASFRWPKPLVLIFF